MTWLTLSNYNQMFVDSKIKLNKMENKHLILVKLSQTLYINW